ncbi:MAG: hypothetical protein AAF809_06885 [Bacteroidota bacterium]
MRAFLVLLLACALHATAYAQIFDLLPLPQSPEAVALGDAAVATPTADALGFLSNPALLGHPAAHGVRLSGAPSTDWLGFDSINLSSYALMAGLDGRRFGFPFHVGLGIARGTISFDVPPTGESVPFDADLEGSFTAVNVGIGYDGPVRTSLGFGVRWARQGSGLGVLNGEIPPSLSDLEPDELAAVETLELDGTTFDLGLLLEIPLARLVGWRPAGEPAGFDLDVRLAYARMHGAEEASFSPELSGPPLIAIDRRVPRIVRLGWAATAGYDVAVGAGHIRAAALTLSIQADQDVTSQNVGDWFGTIRLADALLGQGNEDREPCAGGGMDFGLCAVNSYAGRRGVQLALGETLTASFGRFEGDGLSEPGKGATAYGLGFSLGGLARLIGLLQDNPRVHRLGERFDLRVTRSVYFANDEDDFDRGTLFWGTTLSAQLP